MARQGSQTAAQKVKSAASLGKMKGAALTLTGDQALIDTLNLLRDSVARRAIKKGLVKAMRIIANGMKAQVPANLKDMKRAIGSRIGKSKKESFTAKAGASVGKAASASSKKRDPKRKGVGIGGRNALWWILGTGPRTVEKTGKNVGSMPAMASQVIKAGFASSSGQAAAVIKSEIAAELAKPHKAK